MLRVCTQCGDFLEMEEQWAPVTHACNPSYLGGRAQKDHGSNPAQENSSSNLSQKNPSKKRVGGMAQGVGPE
jgi:hypothetical protein